MAPVVFARVRSLAERSSLPASRWRASPARVKSTPERKETGNMREKMPRASAFGSGISTTAACCTAAGCTGVPGKVA
jgi:hypothetical protein